MADGQPTTVAVGRRPATPEARGAVAKSVILLGLWAWFFWPELRGIFGGAPANSDWVHVLVTPFAILLLLYLRREYLAERLTRGSVWGVVLIIAGLGSYALTTWPFDFAYVQHLSMVPVLAGVVLTAGGWGVFKHCLPMVLLVLLSIPIGQRIYARIVIEPGTYTLSATRVTLDQLPGVQVRLDGSDFTFTRNQTTGTIALGEPRRGFTLLLSYATIGVFVVFARVRPFWQLVVMGVALVPVALFCNWLRLFTWGIATIYGGAAPVSAVPRATAAIVSLFAAYLIFALMCAVLGALGLERQPEADDSDLERPAPA